MTERSPRDVDAPVDDGRAGDKPLDELRAVLPAWLTASALILVAWAVAAAIDNRRGSRLDGLHLSEGLISWDGTFYRDIAKSGYQALDPEALRFFPLYPFLGRLLSYVTLGHTTVALVVLANVLALVAAVLVRRLVQFETGDARRAQQAVWAMTLFPASFVLAWGYAESLFLVLALTCLLAARRGNFALAGAAAFLAAGTRPVGILLAAPIAVEAWRSLPQLAFPGRVPDRGATPDVPRAEAVLVRLAAIAAPVAMTGAYLFWVERTFGDWRLPLTVQNAYRRPTDPFTRLVRALPDLVSEHRFDDGLHVWFALTFVALLVVVALRWPVSYTVYAGLLLVVALGAENFNSVERYALNAFPLLLALNDVFGTGPLDRPWIRRLAATVSGAGLVGLCTLAWLGIFVP